MTTGADLWILGRETQKGERCRLGGNGIMGWRSNAALPGEGLAEQVLDSGQGFAPRGDLKFPNESALQGW